MQLWAHGGRVDMVAGNLKYYCKHLGMHSVLPLTVCKCWYVYLVMGRFTVLDALSLVMGPHSFVPRMSRNVTKDGDQFDNLLA